MRHKILALLRRTQSATFEMMIEHYGTKHGKEIVAALQELRDEKIIEMRYDDFDEAVTYTLIEPTERRIA